MQDAKYKCLKCAHTEYETGEMRATGSLLTKIFDIQNRKFVTISCKNCGLTEFYTKTGKRTAENVLDFFT